MVGLAIVHGEVLKDYLWDKPDALLIALLTHVLQSAWAHCHQPVANALTHPNSSGDHFDPTRILK